MRYYPIHLDLNGRTVLVVGGGSVAERKAEQLLNAGAVVRVVSPELTPALQSLAERGVIAHRRSEFSEQDLDGAMLVISATDSQPVNEAVSKAARKRGVICNVVDQPALCDFIVGSILARGDLQISISTGGGSPSLAQRVKREIAALIGEEYGELLELAAELRSEVHRSLPDYERRRAVLHAFVESDALELLRSGRRDEARMLAYEMLSRVATEEDASVSKPSERFVEKK
jgi:precorrin-2 dehydrogenase